MAIIFALSDSALERVNFAGSFRRLEQDLDRSVFVLLVDTKAPPPTANITVERFFELVRVVESAQQRKAIINPFALGAADFVFEVEAGLCGHMPADDPTPAWVYPVQRAGVVAKMGIAYWFSPVPKVASVPVEHLGYLSRALQRLFGLKGPDWALAIRELADKAKTSAKADKKPTATGDAALAGGAAALADGSAAALADGDDALAAGAAAAGTAAARGKPAPSAYDPRDDLSVASFRRPRAPVVAPCLKRGKGGREKGGGRTR